jgi:hypothetical protein
MLIRLFVEQRNTGLYYNPMEIDDEWNCPCHYGAQHCAIHTPGLDPSIACGRKRRWSRAMHRRLVRGEFGKPATHPIKKVYNAIKAFFKS